jgi:hypothetical protein
VLALCRVLPYRNATVAVGLLTDDDDASYRCVFAISFNDDQLAAATPQGAASALQRLQDSFEPAVRVARNRGIRHVIALIPNESSHHAEAQIIQTKGNAKLCAIAINRPVCARDPQPPRRPSNADTTCSQRLSRLNQTTCAGQQLWRGRVFDDLRCP